MALAFYALTHSFINLYIVFKSPLSLLSSSVVFCISLNISSYLGFPNVAPFCCSSQYSFQFSHMLFLVRKPYNFCIIQFWSNHQSNYFSHYMYISKWKAIFIFLSIMNVSPNILHLYFCGDKLSCITSPCVVSLEIFVYSFIYLFNDIFYSIYFIGLLLYVYVLVLLYIILYMCGKWLIA